MLGGVRGHEIGTESERAAIIAIIWQSEVEGGGQPWVEGKLKK
jgi:hypothetical protein